MLRILRWLLGGLLIGAVLLVVSALWSMHRDRVAFRELPAGARQLAIFDAFAQAIERNYLDRRFLMEQWPALRDHWRAKAASATDDVYLYDQIFVPLTQKFPSSHVGVIAPAAVIASVRSAPASVDWERDFDIARVRRGAGMLALVGDVRAGGASAQAGIEPGWLIVTLPGCRDGVEAGVFLTVGTPEQRLTREITGTFALTDPSVHDATQITEKYQRTLSYNCVPAREVSPLDVRDIEGVTVIRLDHFDSPTVIDAVLAALDRATARGVILDLRHNRGGLESEAQRVASRLMPEGSITCIKVQNARRDALRAGSGPKADVPLAVLVGPATASAGEMLAAALQDHRRALLIGRATSGNTMLARGFPLPDGGFAQIAIAEALRPEGGRIEGVGVNPDIGVMPSLADVRDGKDPALARAIAELTAH